MFLAPPGDKPLSELILAYFTDAYIHHPTSVNDELTKNGVIVWIQWSKPQGHYSDETWPSMGLKSRVTQLFVQQLVDCWTNNKKTQ